MKKLILTTLDDNHKLYYDCFIPFILSLKQTDFNGDIGIISYQLSPDKQNVLKEQGIKIFPASNMVSEMLMDRHISAANIAEEYGYEQVAVYDADIWFPNKHLTIFNQIKNNDTLYCAYDLYRCTFLTNCIASSHIEKINQSLDQVTKNTGGYVWQAGLIIGDKSAWVKYKQYVLEQLAQPEYILTYGIDSTLLNLYSLKDPNNVQHLPERYNCIPVWGIKVQFDYTQNNYIYLVNDELIEGIHVTRAHRDGGEFSYIKWYEKHYYQWAKQYREADYPYYNITKESLLSDPHRIYQKEPIELELIDAKANVLSYHTDGDDTCINVQGDSRLTFRNPSDTSITLFFHWRSVMNFGMIKKVYIIKDHYLTVNYHTNTYITLAPNETISFVTEEPDVKAKSICWCIKSLRII